MIFKVKNGKKRKGNGKMSICATRLQIAPSGKSPEMPSVTRKVRYTGEKIGRGKILVFGTFNIEERFLYGIAKEFGISKDQIVIIKDYDKIKKTSLRHLQWNLNYAGVLLGPIPHSSQNIGDNNSVVAMLKREDGFPPCEQILTLAGGFKISKTAFKLGLMKLLSKLEQEDRWAA